LLEERYQGKPVNFDLVSWTWLNLLDCLNLLFMFNPSSFWRGLGERSCFVRAPLGFRTSEVCYGHLTSYRVWTLFYYRSDLVLAATSRVAILRELLLKSSSTSCAALVLLAKYVLFQSVYLGWTLSLLYLETSVDLWKPWLRLPQNNLLDAKRGCMF